MKKLIQKWIGITDVKDDVKELVRCHNHLSYDFWADRKDNYDVQYKFRPKSYDLDGDNRKCYWNGDYMNLED